MKANRKYIFAVALLSVLAVVFGLAGTAAPVSEHASSKQSFSSSDSVTHFMNPPTYDSGWVNITDKCGQNFTLVHNLNTTDITVDITGRTAILTEENWDQFWGMGDVNRDGYIDDTDGDLIMAAWGSYPGHPNWNPDADLNQDLQVNVFDAVIFSSNYGLDIWTHFVAGTHQRNFGGTCYAPGWSKTYENWGECFGHSVIQTSDGGYAIAGWHGDPWAPMFDILLVKTDSVGNKQWSGSYGVADTDYPYSLVQTNDGGYAMGGIANFAFIGPTGKDAYLVKTDLEGNMQWQKTYGDLGTDCAYSMVQTTDGGYAMAGYTNSFGTDLDAWLIKTDSNGNMQWQKTYGDLGTDCAYSMVQTTDGGYALAGYTYSYGAGSSDFWLVKTDSTGNHLWNQTYGGANGDAANSLVQTGDGGYAMVGYAESFGAGAADFWLVKTDTTGNEQWNKTYGGIEDDTAFSLVQTGDGGYAMVGYAESFGAGAADFWLVKTGVSGNVQWQGTYGGPNDDCAYSLVQTNDGGYALAGYTYPFGAGPRFWLVKTDVESGLAWADSTSKTVTLYRGRTDPYWNFVRVRVWTVEEPTWQYGDIDMDGDVDYDDFIVLAGNYGKTYSALSLGGIVAIAGIYTYKKRKQPK